MFFFVAHITPNMFILHEFLKKRFCRLQAKDLTAPLISSTTIQQYRNPESLFDTRTSAHVSHNVHVWYNSLLHCFILFIIVNFYNISIYVPLNYPDL
jgi:hypothetical protein